MKFVFKIALTGGETREVTFTGTDVEDARQLALDHLPDEEKARVRSITPIGVGGDAL